MDEKNLLQTINYTINIQEYEKAFIAFQKKFVFPKNTIMTAAFIIIIILYVNQLYQDPTYKMAWILIGVCAAFIALIWYNAFKIRKTLIKSIKDIKDDKYTTNIYDDSIVVQTELAQNELTDGSIDIEPKTILFIDDNPEVAENDEMFIIYLKKQMFYVIPKHQLMADQIESLSKIFEEKLDKRFKKSIKL